MTEEATDPLPSPAPLVDPPPPPLPPLLLVDLTFTFSLLLTELLDPAPGEWLGGRDLPPDVLERADADEDFDE